MMYEWISSTNRRTEKDSPSIVMKRGCVARTFYQILLFVSFLIVVSWTVGAEEGEPGVDEEIYRQVFGESPPTHQEVQLSIFLDETTLGQASAVLNGTEKAIFKTHELIELLSPYLKEGVLERLGLSPDEVELQELKEKGVDAEYQHQDLSVIFHFPAEMRRPVTHQLRRPAEPVGIEEIRTPDFSAYLNYYSGFSYNYKRWERESEHRLPLWANLYPNLQLARWVLEGGVRMRSEFQPYFELDSLLLRRDFPQWGSSLSMGTVSAAGSAYLPNSPIDGLSYGTKDVLRQFSHGHSFDVREIFLDEASEVSVYLNERLLFRRQMEAGNHELTDFPYLSGLNELRITVTGADGVERELSTLVPFDSRILSPGQFDYGIAIGTPRYSFSDPLLSGFVTYGINRQLSLGSTMQADMESYVGKSHLLFASPVGNWEAVVGASLRTALDPGYYGRLQYRLHFASHRSLPSFGASAELQSRSFLDSVGAEPGETASYSIRGNVGQSLPGGAYLNGVAAYGQDDEGASRFSSSLTFLKSLSRDTSLSMSLSVYRDDLQQWDWQGHLSMSIRPSGSRRNTNYTQNLKTGDAAVRYSAGKTRQDFSPVYSIGLTGYPPESAEHTSLNAGVSLSHPYFRASLDNTGTYTGSQPGDYWENRFSAGASGALLFSGGHFALSQPVHDSFLLVVPEGLPAETSISVFRGTGGTRESRGETLAFNDLSSYRRSRIIFELPDSPPDTILDRDIILLTPYYRSGILLTPQVRRSLYAKARLLTLDDEAVSLQAGELIPIGDTRGESQLFFTDEEGWTQFYDIYPGDYRLRLFAEEIAAKEITVPDGVESPHQLGTITLPVVQQ